MLLRTTRSLLTVGDLKLPVPSACLPTSPSPHIDRHLLGHRSPGYARFDFSNHKDQGPHTPPLVSLPLSEETRKFTSEVSVSYLIKKYRGRFYAVKVQELIQTHNMFHDTCFFFFHAVLTSKQGCQRNAISYTHKLY